MRANDFITESAVEDLKNKLPSLKNTSYDTIDELMQKISRRYKLTGKKLHDLFVHKYGHTPDTWIKKIKNRISTEEIEPTDDGAYTVWAGGLRVGGPNAYEKARALDSDSYTESQQGMSEGPKEVIGLAKFAIGGGIPGGQRPADILGEKDVTKDLSEDVQGPNEVQQIKDFIKWSMKTLNIKTKPKFTLSKNTEQAQAGHHTGVHSGDRIWVYIGNRNLIDIFRTIFHELVHQRQSELNMIKDGDSYPGSPIEAMADMMAGKYIKIYGKEHPEIFQ